MDRAYMTRVWKAKTRVKKEDEQGNGQGKKVEMAEKR